MMKRSIWLFLFIVVVLGWMKPDRGFTSERVVRIASPTRTFFLDGPEDTNVKWCADGYIVQYERAHDERPMIWIYTSAGQRVNQFSPIKDFSDAQLLDVHDIAMTKYPTLMLAVVVVHIDGRMASALLEYDFGGELKRIIKTDPFVPDEVDVDRDGNIWMLGYDWQQLHKNSNWPLIRKISMAGKPLLSALPRSLFPEKSNPLDIGGPGIVISHRHFKAVGETIYAWLPGVNQLAVLDLDGELRDLIRAPFRSAFGRGVKSLEVRSLVFLPGGRMVLSSNGYRAGKPPVGGWFFSDDRGRSWKRMTMEFQDPLRVRVIGFAGPSEAVAVDFTLGPGIVGFCPVEF